MSETRKLAAILVSDVVGYSRLTGTDEDRTLARLRALRSDLVDPTVAVHNGRVVKRTGDGSIIEFRSVVDAVNCAIEVQRAMVERNAGVAPDKRIEFRVGIHLGDVVEESDGDLMGDGVNIAARLEGVAKPGAICLSEDAYRQVKGRLDLAVSDLGPTQLKNIAEPIRVYSLDVGKPAQAKPAPTPTPEKSAPPRLSLVVLPFANIGGDHEQEYFADGVTESLTTDLSRISGAFVIARNTAFTYKRRATDVKQIGRDLNVRYVLEGSVQRAETACGSTCNSSTPRWAIIYGPSGSTNPWPISSTCRTSRLPPRQPARAGTSPRRSAPRRTLAQPGFYGPLFHRVGLFNKGMTAELLDKARSHFDRSLDLDPDNVDALVGRARVEVASVAGWLSEDRRMGGCVPARPTSARRSD